MYITFMYTHIYIYTCMKTMYFPQTAKPNNQSFRIADLGSINGLPAAAESLKAQLALLRSVHMYVYI